MQLDWRYNSFDELNAAELYAIIQLRNKVFVVEQDCVYLDTDGKDTSCYHLAGWDDKNLVAYCRLLPPGLAFKEASIGRVVTAPAYRNAGMGRTLMKQAIALTLQEFTCNKIIIGAQLYLKDFYASLGFIPISETYLEDNIPHIEMEFTA